MKVLVTGGAGYIGSHAVKHLLENGHMPIVVDNLSRGHREAVPRAAKLFEVDIRETERLETILKGEQVECVMHFAALAYVGESVDHPLRYYDNNTRGAMSVLQACASAGVERFVFSSTCATYGEPKTMPIVEDMPQNPINPYGASKLFTERMLLDFSRSRPSFGFTALRYFNVAGSARDGSIGEHHEPETHLIPVILQAALGVREKVTVFGEDYPTADGTCIRDYIHVDDLVRAHVVAMQKIQPGDQRFYNLGIGRGYSVKEILEATRRVVDRPFKVETGPRRPGDPPELYANADRIAKELGWKAEITDIGEIIESAWRWFREHPRGYGSSPA
jgi:UDP-glucose 4-epimerase